MKKIFLVAAIAVMGVSFGQEDTGFKAGVHIGLPIGDAGDAYSFNVGGDVAYTFYSIDKLELGAATGYSYYVGKEQKFAGITLPGGVTIPGGVTVKQNAGIIPIAVTGKYGISENFFLGADLGYAFFTGDVSGGGFYYQPKIGYNLPSSEIYASYKGISKDGTLATINVGFNYKF